jgi:hypothetical protein
VSISSRKDRDTKTQNYIAPWHCKRKGWVRGPLKHLAKEIRSLIFFVIVAFLFCLFLVCLYILSLKVSSLGSYSTLPRIMSVTDYTLSNNLLECRAYKYLQYEVLHLSETGITYIS